MGGVPRPDARWRSKRLSYRAASRILQSMKTIVLVAAMAVSALFGSGCDAKCTAVQTDVQPNSARYAWSGCSDNQTRTVECRRSGAALECTCLLGTTAGKTFRVAMPEGAYHSHAVTAESAEKECGWDDVKLTRF